MAPLCQPGRAGAIGAGPNAASAESGCALPHVRGGLGIVLGARGAHTAVSPAPLALGQRAAPGRCVAWKRARGPIAATMPSKIRAILAAALVAAVSGCATQAPAPAPDAGVPVPAAWSRPATGSAPLAAWWRVFGDPLLTQLVDDAARANTDIGAAQANLRQARALREAAAAGLWPRLSVSAGAQPSRGASGRRQPLQRRVRRELGAGPVRRDRPRRPGQRCPDPRQRRDAGLDAGLDRRRGGGELPAVARDASARRIRAREPGGPGADAADRPVARTGGPGLVAGNLAGPQRRRADARPVAGAGRQHGPGRARAGGAHRPAAGGAGCAALPRPRRCRSRRRTSPGASRPACWRSVPTCRPRSGNFARRPSAWRRPTRSACPPRSCAPPLAWTADHPRLAGQHRRRALAWPAASGRRCSTAAREMRSWPRRSRRSTRRRKATAHACSPPCRTWRTRWPPWPRPRERVAALDAAELAHAGRRAAGQQPLRKRPDRLPDRARHAAHAAQRAGQRGRRADRPGHQSRAPVQGIGRRLEHGRHRGRQFVNTTVDKIQSLLGQDATRPWWKRASLWGTLALVAAVGGRGPALAGKAHCGCAAPVCHRTGHARPPGRHRGRQRHAAADQQGRHRQRAVRHGGAGAGGRERHGEEGPGAGRAGHRPAGRPGAAIACGPRGIASQGAPVAGHRAGGHRQPPAAGGGGAPERRPRAVEGGTRDGPGSAGPRQRRGRKRASRRGRRHGGPERRRDQSAQGLDPLTHQRRGAVALGGPGQCGGRFAAGRDAVHAGRGPGADEARGERGRGRRRPGAQRPEGHLQRQRLSRTATTRPRSRA